MAVVTASILALAMVLAPQTSRSSSTRRATEQRRATAEERRANTNQQIDDLKDSVRVLEAEIRALHREVSNSRAAEVSAADMQRLDLLEQREERLENRLDTARQRLRDAEAREMEVQRGLDNVDTERILYGGLNREDSERAVRNNLERAMARVRTEITDAQIEVNRIEQELATTRAAADAMRRKLRMTPEDIAGEDTELSSEPNEDEREIVDPGGTPSDSTTIDPVPPEN